MNTERRRGCVSVTKQVGGCTDCLPLSSGVTVCFTGLCPALGRLSEFYDTTPISCLISAVSRPQFNSVQNRIASRILPKNDIENKRTVSDDSVHLIGHFQHPVCFLLSVATIGKLCKFMLYNFFLFHLYSYDI